MKAQASLCKRADSQEPLLPAQQVLLFLYSVQYGYYSARSKLPREFKKKLTSTLSALILSSMVSAFYSALSKKFYHWTLYYKGHI